MSWETQAWAAKQRPGSASAKLVLLGMASCADANHCAFPSIQWLCDFSDLNRKTVIAAIQRLEDGMFPLIEDTGQRRGRTGQVKVYRLAVNTSGREIGAQVHYVYKLIHRATGQYYVGVRSFIGDPLLDGYAGSGNWPVAMKAAGVTLDKIILAVKDTREEADIAEALAIKNSIGDARCMNIEYKDTEKGVPKAGLFNDPGKGTLEADNSSGFGLKQSQKRDTEPVSNPNPLSTSDEVDAPPADVQPDLLGEGGADGCSPEPAAEPVPDAPPAKPHVLPDDWHAPDIDDLPKEARALVKQWPSGAYAAQCANFKGYWTEIDRQKRTAKGWRATLANWLSRVHAETMRAAKAGVSFDACAVPVASSAPPAAAPPVAAKRREDGQSAALHAAIRAMVGDDAYQRWLEPVAMIVDAPGVVVIVASAFQREWLHDHLHGKLVAAARHVLGDDARWVRIDVERPDDVRALDQQGERRDG